MSTIDKPDRTNQHATPDRERVDRPASARLGKQAKKVTEDLHELGGIAGDAAREKVGQLRENATNDYEKGREKAHQVERTFDQFIQEQPLKCILIAAGIGLLVGRFWMRP